MHVELLDKSVKPSFLYGADISGYGNCDTPKRIHTISKIHIWFEKVYTILHDLWWIGYKAHLSWNTKSPYIILD